MRPGFIVGADSFIMIHSEVNQKKSEDEETAVQKIIEKTLNEVQMETDNPPNDPVDDPDKEVISLNSSFISTKALLLEIYRKLLYNSYREIISDRRPLEPTEVRLSGNFIKTK